MSFNVLILPEDPVKDGYVLKPIIEAMMKAAGKPQARVVVCGSSVSRDEPGLEVGVYSAGAQPERGDVPPVPALCRPRWRRKPPGRT